MAADHPDPLKILNELNSDFQRSKKEQIDRFLKDQDELNKRFTDCSLNSDEEGRYRSRGRGVSDNEDDEDDSEDDSNDDVESQFNLRLDTFRVRPLSARIGSWSLEENNEQSLNKNNSKPFAAIKINNNITEINTERHEPVKVESSAYEKYVRRDRSSSRDRTPSMRPGGRRPVAQSGGGGTLRERNKSRDRGLRSSVDRGNNKQKTETTAGEDTSKAQQSVENSMPQKLLMRRRHRPRTAMGLQITKRGMHSSADVDDEQQQPPEPPEITAANHDTNKIKPPSLRPMRSSAPAAISRGAAQQHKPSWGETAEEMKRTTFMERQAVCQRGRESPGLASMGASVAAVQHKSRQQELLLGSGTNITAPSTPRGINPNPQPLNNWALGGTPRHGPSKKMESLLSPSSGTPSSLRLAPEPSLPFSPAPSPPFGSGNVPVSPSSLTSDFA